MRYEGSALGRGNQTQTAPPLRLKVYTPSSCLKLQHGNGKLPGTPSRYWFVGEKQSIVSLRIQFGGWMVVTSG